MARFACRRWFSIGVASLWLASGTGPALSQLPVEPPPPAKLSGESATTARRLAEARKLADQGKLSDAVEEYQRILDEAGDDLIALDPLKPHHCVQARRLCHIGIAALPPAARKLYRQRADEQAKKWLDQGRADRDPALLRRLIDQAFCSRHTDRALDLLGDLALERGDFEEADLWWRMLALPASEAKTPAPKPAAGSVRLLYPDPQVDVALVRAKQILAKLLRGERAGAKEELNPFRTLHGTAQGHLAGRRGNYVDILQNLADKEGLAGATAEDGWRTFAGAAARTFIVPKEPRCRWLDQPWRVRLDGSDAAQPDNGAPLTPSQAARACAFFPAIVGNLVLVADARSVTAYDLDTGRRVGRFELNDDLKAGVEVDTSVPVKHDLRYTLTVSGDRVYARLGAQGLARPRDAKGEAKPGQQESFLVCLALPPTRDGQLKVVWQAKAPGRDKEWAFFEGAPVVRGTGVYIGRTRFVDDGRALASIECYHAESGAVRWEREICEARESWDSAPRYRHHLLTLAGPNVVYCSHSGAVVAVDAASGKRVWAARYPRRGPRTAEGEQSPRELAPCVYAGGRVYVAPSDCDHLFCVDAASGQLLWDSKALEVVQLLGVARGKLIFTTGSRPRGIRALDAATGADLREWIQPDDGVSELPTLGRGLLAGDWVFWPTVNGLRVLNQEDGSVNPLVPLRNTIKGNLAAGGGCLVVATDRELLGYVPEARRKDAAVPPKRASAVSGFLLSRGEGGWGDELSSAGWSLFEQNAKPSLTIRLASSAHRSLSPQGGREKRSSLALPTPALLLHRAWEISLRDRNGGAGRAGPVAVDSGKAECLLTVQGGRSLCCREAASGKDRWVRTLTHAPGWVEIAGDIVVVGGVVGVSALRLADGKEAWQLGAPATDSGPPEPFTSHQIVAGRLFLIQDERRLFVIEVASGRVLWNCWAPGARVLPLPPAGRFDPNFHAGPDLVVIRCTNGQRWVLDSQTGKKLHIKDGDHEPWPQPPLPLGDGALCLVPDSRRVTKFDPVSGRGAWTHVIDRPTTLTGAPPQLLGSGATLVALVSRNQGDELQRIDAGTGAPRWSQSLGVSGQPIDLSQAAFDDKAVYVVIDNGLRAFSLVDGNGLWESSIGSRPGRWRVVVMRQGLLVHPTEAQGEVEYAALLRRFLATSPAAVFPTTALLPMPVGLPGALATLRREQLPSRIPVVVADPRDGHVIQRLNFDTVGSSAQVTVLERSVVVAGREAAWGIK